jgi:hypothetical protein
MNSVATERTQSKLPGTGSMGSTESSTTIPSAFKLWALNVGTLTTLAASYSGSAEYMKLQLDPVAAPEVLPKGVNVGSFTRVEQSGQTGKIASRALRGGRNGLIFGGLFYGLDSLAATVRGKTDLPNTAFAGLATGVAYVASLPGGGAHARTYRTVLGGVIGMGIGAMVGSLNHSAPRAIAQHKQHMVHSESDDMPSKATQSSAV